MPVVSIAIPTFNRCEKLGRAVESALAQSFSDIEVVVSDNSSDDGTPELLRELAAGDERLKVVSHSVNRGMVANMDSVLRLTRGDHVMLLSDDDWLAPTCAERALEALVAAPSTAAVLGRVAYMRDGREVAAGQPVALRAAEPEERVRNYLTAVDRDHGNTWVYGLMRRGLLDQVSPLRHVLGFDWLRVAEVAFLGRIELLPETLIFRELGGTSETSSRNVSENRLPALHAKVPHFVIARELLADIGWRSPVYASLPHRRRLQLAASCAASVLRRNLRHVLFALAPRRLQEWWWRRSGSERVRPPRGGSPTPGD